MSGNTIANRLTELRRLMQEIGADYYYVPSTDPHNNEYLPAAWQRRAWISGFTGSAGDVLVGVDKAFLWTDPRYFLQAEKQLDDRIYQLMKVGQMPPIDQWLLQQDCRIVFATDPRVITIQQTKKIQQALEKHGGKLLTVDKNLIDRIWKGRPELPKAHIRRQPEQYAGLSAEDKLATLRKTLRAESTDAIVLTMLDAIAWLLNIRGNDVSYNPVVISYVIVTEKEAMLFVDSGKISKEDIPYFKRIHVHIKPYEAFNEALHQLSGKVWIDPNTTSLWIRQSLKNAQELCLKPSPITMAKALKNPVEQQGARDAHIIDAIAMVRFLYWLENHWQEGITEISAAEKLEAFRREDPRCLDLSFPSISGFGPHGAIVHYSATPETDIPINDSSPYLIDSGGQYHSGTTDITRVLHLGTPTEEQKHLYTLVLKGHLAIRHAVFPEGTTGGQINALAHQFLWQEGLDYGHGTGHGVGSYLCVHEGPQAITTQNQVALQPGMIVSNEPGVYLTDKYGIRIENLCLITEKLMVDDSLTGNGPFYGFEDLTLVPYCRNLINVKDLTPQEIKQLDNYHHQVYQTLIDELPADELKSWLRKATAPLLDTITTKVE